MFSFSGTPSHLGNTKLISSALSLFVVSASVHHLPCCALVWMNWGSRVIFQSAHRIKSFFPYKDRINRSQMSKVVYKASCWDCQDFYIGKTKRRVHDRKTEHFKAITSNCHASAIADHITSTGHNLKWDHFDILEKGRSDTHCKIKETLLIRELKPTLNDKVSSEKLYLY